MEITGSVLNELEAAGVLVAMVGALGCIAEAAYAVLARSFRSHARALVYSTLTS